MLINDIISDGKIKIFGAGMSGCYLAKLLDNEGIDYEICDIRRFPDCRCAFGIGEWNTFKNLMKEIGYNAKDYVINEVKNIKTNVVDFKYYVPIIDKRKLLSDLWNELNVKRKSEIKVNDNDIVVDATGYRRALLPKIKNDVLIPCYQIKCKSNLDNSNIYVYISKDANGYAWAFPLGEEWHIGAGHINGKNVAKELILKLIKYYSVKITRPTCKCFGYVRHLPPSKCLPFIKENIVGVGESIGAVTLVGGGNVTSLETSKILFECLIQDELCNYENKVIDYFKLLEMEYKIKESYNNGRKLDSIKLLSKWTLVKIKEGKFNINDIIKGVKLIKSYILGKGNIIKEVKE